MRKFYQNASGAIAVEYGLLLAFITIVAIAGIAALGTATKDLYTGASSALP